MREKGGGKQRRRRQSQRNLWLWGGDRGGLRSTYLCLYERAQCYYCCPTCERWPPLVAPCVSSSSSSSSSVISSIRYQIPRCSTYLQEQSPVPAGRVQKPFPWRLPSVPTSITADNEIPPVPSSCLLVHSIAQESPPHPFPSSSSSPAVLTDDEGAQSMNRYGFLPNQSTIRRKDAFVAIT
ncbi:hypothetical protein GW17_00013234 [Ensete ventricosum]|nr:hypothetical protein GW17_00013234 [Ensete ventricosum]